MQVKVKKVHPAAKLPVYATPGSACFDLSAVNVIHSYDGDPLITFDTCLQFEIPVGYVMLIFSRSGHGFKHGARLANCVGVIDSDYRGNVMVKIRVDSGEDLHVSSGDRIAQAMIVPASQVTLIEADELSETERGEGGFGSTGVK